MKKKIDVLAVGSLNVDLIIIGNAPREMNALLKWVGPSQVELVPAGSVGYCAIDLARLGLKVSMVSTVADDIFGRWIIQGLKKEGINTSLVDIEKGASSGIGIYMLLFGSRKRPLTGRLATNKPWPKLSRAIEAKLKEARLLHCGGYLHYSEMWGKPTEALFKTAKEYGLITSLDSQFPLTEIEKPWLRHFGKLPEYLDIIFTDEEEAKAITGTKSPEHSAKVLIDAGIKIVVVKRGAEGALIATKKEFVHQPAFRVEDMVDSIGAGDAFDAGVIYGVLNQWSLKKTASFASAVAALTLKGAGGIQTAPGLKKVLKFMNQSGLSKF